MSVDPLDPLVKTANAEREANVVPQVSKAPLVSLDPLAKMANADPLAPKENAANAESVAPQAPQGAPTSTWPGRCA